MSTAIGYLKGSRLAREIEVDPHDSTVVIDEERVPAGSVAWDVPTHGSVYGALLNDRAAFEALGGAVHEPPYNAPPQAPILYIKPQNTVAAYGMPIPIPNGVPQLQVGATLGVVIGKRATKVQASDAPQYIAGYTVVNDVSVPHESVYRPAISEKCRDGFCPIGPWVIQADEVRDADQLAIRVYVNGELRQEASTATLVRPVSHLLADVTEFMTLDAGDVLLVGVPHGAPLVGAGDRVKIEIDGVGHLENTVVQEDECLHFTMGGDSR
ncbi:fumarylacetoacetate hydrolase family protein [Alicyclobacillus sp. ALC3]|uniref:fumarylacetoacetate hydrolase family protein n=1 Tax=Alicyclobacillus sp. ALC3 TaxID=2796143 RepID=UPI00237810E1|nr:fumarylacetoacetate hydrolase family protein [Alicyclobacillus sp. ALC3]WDL95718.1 fumarylacetoacetate hydrolase family protein [Alicyclobacillus sp. ALC3]